MKPTKTERTTKRGPISYGIGRMLKMRALTRDREFNEPRKDEERGAEVVTVELDAGGKESRATSVVALER